MRTFVKELTNPGVTLTAYLPVASDEMPNYKTRPAILVIPGGAYMMCSDREAEPIALSFLAKGYAAFVLRYSVGKGAAKFPRPLNDAEEAMELIIANAEEWGVEPEHIAAVGFSAGGHLCAALGTMGRVRPAACVLGYPCILSSIGRILAEPIPSLDEKVDANTPPTFIVAAREDGCVPIENSLAYAAALDKAGVPFEMHIYERGYHGFSVADGTVYSKPEDAEYNSRIKGWLDICIAWLNTHFNRY